MNQIFYNSDITPDSASEIKLLTLYYDKITIVNDAVYTPRFTTTNGEFKFARTEDLQFIPSNFRDEYKILLDEGIMQITERDKNDSDAYGQQFASKIGGVLSQSQDFIFPVHPKEADVRIVTEEVYLIMKHMLGFEWGKPIEVDYVQWYYSLKLKWMLQLLMNGKSCITSSNNLQYLFSSFMRSQNGQAGQLMGRSKSMALDALKLSLPNPDMLSIDDILELKLRLKDELLIFSHTINSIEVRNRDIVFDDDSEERYRALFYDEIQRPLRELEFKMKNLKSKTFRQFVDKIKDYKSYSPLIGTVVASLPVQYAVLASLGMTLGQSYLEFKEDHREIQNNGLYFLLKMK